jgi:uncharacterized protein (TIGR03083 family)
MRTVLSGNDERFVATAHQLSNSEWARPSLCGEWSNHEVLAHLVHGYSASVAQFAGRMYATRGNFDAANSTLARELARRRSPGELLDDLQALSDNPRGLGRLLPKRLMLGDHVLHELDIMFALERPATVPGDVLAAVLDTQVAIPNPFVPARRRGHGLTLRATDIDWTRPGHPELIVAGTAADLASVLAGRPHAITRLTGHGVGLLEGRLA